MAQTAGGCWRFLVSPIGTGCQIGKRSRGYRNKAADLSRESERPCSGRRTDFLVIAERNTCERRANGEVTAGSEPRERARAQRSRRNVQRNRHGILGKCDIYVKSVAKTSHTIQSAAHGRLMGPWTVIGEECDNRDGSAATRQRSIPERLAIEVISDIAKLHRLNWRRSPRSSRRFLAGDGTTSFRTLEALYLLVVRKYTDESDHGAERFTGDSVARSYTPRDIIDAPTNRRRCYVTVATSVSFVYSISIFHIFDFDISSYSNVVKKWSISLSMIIRRIIIFTNSLVSLFRC